MYDKRTKELLRMTDNEFNKNEKQINTCQGGKTLSRGIYWLTLNNIRMRIKFRKLNTKRTPEPHSPGVTGR